MSQNAEILKHLKRGRKITPLQALKLFGCFRLGARVYDLKKRGHEITSKTVIRSGKRVAEYSM